MPSLRASDSPECVEGRIVPLTDMASAGRGLRMPVPAMLLDVRSDTAPFGLQQAHTSRRCEALVIWRSKSGTPWHEDASGGAGSEGMVGTSSVILYRLPSWNPELLHLRCTTVFQDRLAPGIAPQPDTIRLPRAGRACSHAARSECWDQVVLARSSFVSVGGLAEYAAADQQMARLVDDTVSRAAEGHDSCHPCLASVLG